MDCLGAEFDTYKIGTTRNSCSKMHKIHVKKFTYDDFDHEGIDACGELIQSTFDTYINTLEQLRQKFNETHEKKYWRAIIEMLPMGFRLRASVDFDYETARSIYFQREGHKMNEWEVFRKELETLPYAKQTICYVGE